MELKLSDSIAKLKGVGEKRAQLYYKLGVYNIGDLITFYPRDYLDFSNTISISETALNEYNTVIATVFRKSGEQRIRKGLSLFKVYVTDGTQNMVITIFNAKFQYEQLKENETYYFYGKVTGSLLRKEMSSPMFLKAEETVCLMQPVYHLTEGLSNKIVQTQVQEALKLWGDCLEDTLPAVLKQSLHLCQYRYAVENIHFPKDAEALQLAKKRLVLEELLVLQLGLFFLRRKNRAQTAIQLENTDITAFYQALPFTLTDGQQQAISESLEDMQKKVPMNRLVQGDVGSGKTMVAAALSYACAKNGYQSAIMAPTQILAEQHFATLSKLLVPLGVQVCLLTGAQKQSERKQLQEYIANGEYSVIIGTHTLVQESVQFQQLGLVVTDEQHRFGVAQRATLTQKGENPHLLVMSATPIPRTLALIIYGDLDISVIKVLPKGRKPIETYAVNSAKRMRALNFVKKHLEEGRQAYIVCPLIEENESDLLSITQYVQALQNTPLKEYPMEALHGKLKPTQKEEIMRRFQQNEVRVLVSTTVVEVGVDVPNANIMLIENAERFGLSQLHQLRGRVGRGEHQSYCILISDHQGEETQHRLKIMAQSSDGFFIAEQDLKMRGPGDFFGIKQHGLPALKIANLIDDMSVLHQAQSIAQDILGEDPDLTQVEYRGLKTKVELLFMQNGQELMS